MMLRIVLLGDFAPDDMKSNVRFEIDMINADLVLMNLETPFPRQFEKRPKAGPNLAGNIAALSQLKSKNCVLSLANNHMMDYGEIGLFDTIHACNNAGFETIGAESNLEKALTPIILNILNVKIGILACAETQFGIATPWRAGVAPIIIGDIEERIRRLAKEVDIVIISVHGAAELCPWPSPYWQDMLHGFIDAGASIIHGHHSHVPQGYEEYHGGLIFYGLGNFLVNPAKWKDTTNALWSLVGDIIVSKKGIEKIFVKKVVIEDFNNTNVRESNESEDQILEEYLTCANIPLSNRKLLSGLWQEISIRMYHQWNAKWLGFESEILKLGVRDRIRNIIICAITIITGNNKRYLVPPSQNRLLLWYHLFACESHRDSIATALGVLSKELEDMRNEETQTLSDKMMPWSCTEVKK